MKSTDARRTKTPMATAATTTRPQRLVLSGNFSTYMCSADNMTIPCPRGGSFSFYKEAGQIPGGRPEILARVFNIYLTD